MRITYDMIWIKRARTPGLMRARVFERGESNSIDRMLGKRDYHCEREWIGCERWFNASNLRERGSSKLETFLSSKTHYISKVEEASACPLPSLTITFGSKREYASGKYRRR